MSGSSDHQVTPSGPIDIGRTGARLTPNPPLNAVWEALRGVYDPELGLDVVSLGLVYDVHEKHGNIVVEMTLTTPGCPVSESLPQEAREAVRDAVGPTIGVQVEVVWDPPWSPALLDEDAASRLGFRLG